MNTILSHLMRENTRERVRIGSGFRLRFNPHTHLLSAYQGPNWLQWKNRDDKKLIEIDQQKFHEICRLIAEILGLEIVYCEDGNLCVFAESEPERPLRTAGFPSFR